MSTTRVASDPLARLGGRSDKNALGQGDALAVYAGAEPRFSYATHALGEVCSLARGDIAAWDGARIQLAPRERGGVVERTALAVLPGDVLVAEVVLENRGASHARARCEWSGDLAGSRDYRGEPGGAKEGRLVQGRIELRDGNVYPALLPRGLSIVVAATHDLQPFAEVASCSYRVREEHRLAPGEQRVLRYAIALDPELERARALAAAALAARDPLADAAAAVRRALDEELPRFACSDAGLEELWTLRAWLLRFSTVSRAFGHFTRPVVLEGREAYQTYCCYSAPFLALDLAWARDPRRAVDSLAPLLEAAYEDGRLPWYCSPSTSRVPVHHASQTGLSLAAFALARAHAIHGERCGATELLPALLRNLRWWRDARAGQGLVAIEHPYETGMDDLRRFEAELEPFLAIDATSYLAANANAVAQLARAAGNASAEREARAIRDAAVHALRTSGWDPARRSYFDRRARDGEPSSLHALTAFYPFLADVADDEHLPLLRELLDPRRYALPRGLPAIAADQPGFDPRGYWMGPSWPAATAHVLEAFARTAKRRDRAQLGAAGALLLRSARLHLRPRADFYERYDPRDGSPLSRFRDYMHSWWLDLFVRHIGGFEPDEHGGLRLDPLPTELVWWRFESLPWRGRRVDLAWSAEEGLRVAVDGAERLHERAFRPGDAALLLPP
ncbi:MAG: hypothetical protein IPN34_25770 [Planctomycetes bacterium]|nr:hypothetical protein [Planctomycetota bacterium]